MAVPTQEHVVSGDPALRLVYCDLGAGPAVVLLHGMFGDHLDWEPVLAPLARRFRVIGVDLPGFGDSSKPDRAYTGEHFAENLAGLLTALGLDRAALVGNSFGGEIALLTALRYPERVERLVLVSTGGFRRIPEAEQQEIRRRYNEATLAQLTPEMHRLMFAPIFVRHGEQWERYLARQDAKLQRPDLPAYARALARSIELAMSLYLLDRLPAIGCPTLLLWGSDDRVIPVELARQALPQLPRGELVLLPGCGHAPQLDCPEAFVRALEAFLLPPPACSH